jgi:hypothetical protein
VSKCEGTVRRFTVTYVQSPEVQIRNDLVIPQWVDSPHTEFQGFNIAEIEDEVPTIMGTSRTACIFSSHQ